MVERSTDIPLLAHPKFSNRHVCLCDGIVTYHRDTRCLLFLLLLWQEKSGKAPDLFRLLPAAERKPTVTTAAAAADAFLCFVCLCGCVHRAEGKSDGALPLPAMP